MKNQINWKTVNHEKSECNHFGLKAMGPNITWCIHAWSPCFLHTQLPYSLQAASSACLALLAVEQSLGTCSSIQVLASFPLVRICTYVRVLSFCPSVQCRLMQISYCCLTVDEFVFMGEHVLDAPWFLIYGTGRHWVLQGQLQLHRNREVQDLFSVGWSTCLHIMVIIFWSVSLLQKMYFEEHEQRYRSRK